MSNVRVPNGVVVVGSDFYQSVVATQPGFVLGSCAGAIPLETVALGTSYSTRADFERGVHEAEPGADLERFEKKAGR